MHPQADILKRDIIASPHVSIIHRYVLLVGRGGGAGRIARGVYEICIGGHRLALGALAIAPHAHEA